tara:strand:+ start:150 stop:347 length:198 start_codon:yes stop_codon:yes gene_type:complete
MKERLDSLKTALANIEVDFECAMREINSFLEFGWRQVDERIEGLRELECVKEEMINKWGEVNECD